VVQRTVGLNKGAVFAGGAARPSLENAPCSTYPHHVGSRSHRDANAAAESAP
jgi:hypothetical protein